MCVLSEHHGLSEAVWKKRLHPASSYWNSNFRFLESVKTVESLSKNAFSVDFSLSQAFEGFVCGFQKDMS